MKIEIKKNDLVCWKYKKTSLAFERNGLNPDNHTKSINENIYDVAGQTDLRHFV